MNFERFHENVKATCKTYKQKDLAKECRVSPATISNWYNGKRPSKRNFIVHGDKLEMFLRGQIEHTRSKKKGFIWPFGIIATGTMLFLLGAAIAAIKHYFIN